MVSRHRFRHAATVAISLLLTLCGAELFVRASGLAQPAWVHADPTLGWSNLPGAAYAHRGEGASSGRINSRGLRDVEHPLHKPDGTYRILILGDSFSEAFQVPLEQSYPRILEERLNAIAGLGPIDVVNMSRSGMGTSQQRAWFLAEGRRYEPDLVLLQVYLNDPVDSSPDLGGREDVPYYQLVGNDLVADESFRHTPAYRVRSLLGAIRSKSALIEMAWQGVRRSLVMLPKDIREPSREHLSADALENQYRDDPPPQWRAALALTDAVLAALADDVHRAGARLVVFVATDSLEVEPVGQELALRLGLDLEQPERWWRQASERHDAQFVPLLDGFRQRRLATDVSPHGSGAQVGSGHWNTYGHRWTAEILAERLAPTIRADRLAHPAP